MHLITTLTFSHLHITLHTEIYECSVTCPQQAHKMISRHKTRCRPAGKLEGCSALLRTHPLPQPTAGSLGGRELLWFLPAAAMSAPALVTLSAGMAS